MSRLSLKLTSLLAGAALAVLVVLLVTGIHAPLDAPVPEREHGAAVVAPRAPVERPWGHDTLQRHPPSATLPAPGFGPVVAPKPYTPAPPTVDPRAFRP